MKVHIQLNLLIVAALYLVWALFLFMGQQQAHPLLSNGPYDAATTSMFGASLFAFVVLFIIAFLNPVKELVYASIAALGFLVLVSLYQLFLSGGMPQNSRDIFWPAYQRYGRDHPVLFDDADSGGGRDRAPSGG